MVKFLGIKLETATELEAYKKLTDCRKAVKRIEDEIREYFANYMEMEGKNAIGIREDGYTYGQGGRGFDYIYANEKTRKSEEEEREEYYNQKVAPLKEYKETLLKKETEYYEDLKKIIEKRG